MDKPAATRFVALMNRMSLVILIFVLLFVVYLIARFVRCMAISPRRLQNRFADENPSIVAIPAGLDRKIIEALPIFVYKSQSFRKGFDCAVCLSEFQENENGRVLPNCNHSFHKECIDMWFRLHSTCPVCRARIRAFSSGKGAESCINYEGLAAGDQAAASENNGGFLCGHGTKGQTSSNAAGMNQTDEIKPSPETGIDIPNSF